MAAITMELALDQIFAAVQMGGVASIALCQFALRRATTMGTAAYPRRALAKRAGGVLTAQFLFAPKNARTLVSVWPPIRVNAISGLIFSVTVDLAVGDLCFKMPSAILSIQAGLVTIVALQSVRRHKSFM